MLHRNRIPLKSPIVSEYLFSKDLGLHVLNVSVYCGSKKGLCFVSCEERKCVEEIKQGEI